MQGNQSAGLGPADAWKTRIGDFIRQQAARCESSGSSKHRNAGRAALTVDVVDAYVKVLPEDGQVEVALARARAVRHEQAGGTARVRTGRAAAEHCAGLRAGS